MWDIIKIAMVYLDFQLSLEGFPPPNPLRRGILTTLTRPEKSLHFRMKILCQIYNKIIILNWVHNFFVIIFDVS